ncbi:MAG: hypothetical protein JNM56_01095 [Planctomycetia bacterium]|nr:hypothetical protein [Planctomycetia bacterium]
MYLCIPTQRSCARAWVAAAAAVIQAGDDAYNVVIDVEDPSNHDDADNAAITLVDRFLRDHEENPVVTVANTIFPKSTYQAHGVPDFYAVEHRNHDRLTVTKRWGRYFERMTRRVDAEGQTYNPLAKIIEKLRNQNGARTPFKAAYELPTYNPDLDRNRYRDAPCLSYLSFKRHPERGLMLTALYRNHSYITRCLGNLIGLGRLQAFVAKEAGLNVGSLTCISTHAELDTKANHWGIEDARGLVQRAAGLLVG